MDLFNPENDSVGALQRLKQAVKDGWSVDFRVPGETDISNADYSVYLKIGERKKSEQFQDKIINERFDKIINRLKIVYEQLPPDHPDKHMTTDIDQTGMDIIPAKGNDPGPDISNDADISTPGLSKTIAGMGKNMGKDGPKIKQANSFPTEPLKKGFHHPPEKNDPPTAGEEPVITPPPKTTSTEEPIGYPKNQRIPSGRSDASIIQSNKIPDSIKFYHFIEEGIREFTGDDQIPPISVIRKILNDVFQITSDYAAQTQQMVGAASGRITRTGDSGRFGTRNFVSKTQLLTWVKNATMSYLYGLGEEGAKSYLSGATQLQEATNVDLTKKATNVDLTKKVTLSTQPRKEQRGEGGAKTISKLAPYIAQEAMRQVFIGHELKAGHDASHKKLTTIQLEKYRKTLLRSNYLNFNIDQTFFVYRTIYNKLVANGIYPSLGAIVKEWGKLIANNGAPGTEILHQHSGIVTHSANSTEYDNSEDVYSS